MTGLLKKLAGVAFALGLMTSAGPALAGEPGPNEVLLDPESLAAFSEHPELLVGLAAHMFELSRAEMAAERKAIFDYFVDKASQMKHALWVGNVTSTETGFLFVDFGDPAGVRVFDAAETFARKTGRRLMVLPAFVDDAMEVRAVNGWALVASGKFAPFYAAANKKAAEYSGDVLAYLNEGDRAMVVKAAQEPEAREDAQLSRPRAV